MDPGLRRDDDYGNARAQLDYSLFRGMTGGVWVVIGIFGQALNPTRNWLAPNARRDEQCA
jgi:hypothetical protein